MELTTIKYFLIFIDKKKSSQATIYMCKKDNYFIFYLVKHIVKKIFLALLLQDFPKIFRFLDNLLKVTLKNKVKTKKSSSQLEMWVRKQCKRCFFMEAEATNQRSLEYKIFSLN